MWFFMLSLDLRKRIVHAYTHGEGSMRELAKRFSVSYNTVLRSVHRVGELGSWVRGKFGQNAVATVDPQGQQALRQWLKEQPDQTLAQLCTKYEARFAIRVPLSTMGHTLRRMGYTRKKSSYMPRNNNAKTSKSDDKSFASSVRKSTRKTLFSSMKRG